MWVRAESPNPPSRVARIERVAAFSAIALNRGRREIELLEEEAANRRAMNDNVLSCGIKGLKTNIRD